MVKFMVKVRLIENNVNSHVGSVMVVKVMSQYRARGMTWKVKVNTQPIHPAIVDGIGGGKGGGEEEISAADWAEVAREGAETSEAVAVMAVVAVRLKERDGARSGMTCGPGMRQKLRFSKKTSREPGY